MSGLVNDLKKMRLEMLQFLSANPEGRGFKGTGANAIARYLAAKGYKPLREDALHPKVTTALVKSAVDDGLIEVDKRFKDVTEGYRKPYYITDKGQEYLERAGLMRFIETSELEQIQINPDQFKRMFNKAQNELDNASLKYTLPNGFETEEYALFFERCKEETARKMRSAVTIQSFVPKDGKRIPVGEEELSELCSFMATYHREENSFAFVLNYDPSRKNSEMNKKLANELEEIDFDYFVEWLQKCKNLNVSKKKIQSLDLRLFEQGDNANASEEAKQYRILWNEYETKKGESNSLIEKIRWAANEEDDFSKQTLAVKQLTKQLFGKSDLKSINAFLAIANKVYKDESKKPQYAEGHKKPNTNED